MSSPTYRHAAASSALTLSLLLAACGSQPPRPVVDRADKPEAATSVKPAPKPVTSKRGGGYYQDDGPGDNEPAPEVLAATPDATPRKEPLHKFANNPYTVLGKTYTPLREFKPYTTQGIASWYGRKFHGQKTSTGEAYDMYGMSAAHPTLPIPSYVRVTGLKSGNSVIVRVNDRGPFHADRVIDLSYTAAWKLGLITNGSGPVKVELIHPNEYDTLAKSQPATKPVAEQTKTPETAEATKPSATPTPIASTQATPAAPGAYIQLGAFGNPDNAESFRNHLARELDWLGDKLRLESAGKILRVQAGPYKDRAEAEAVADKIRAAMGVKPTIVSR